MFRSKKTKTEYVSIAKDWRDSWHEVELLGTKLDQARKAVKDCTPGTWAHDFWTTTADRLFKKWKLTSTMREVGLKQKGPVGGITRRYDWWEGSEEPASMPWLPSLGNFFENAGLGHRLDESWARSKELSFQKARQGLA